MPPEQLRLRLRFGRREEGPGFWARRVVAAFPAHSTASGPLRDRVLGDAPWGAQKASVPEKQMGGFSRRDSPLLSVIRGGEGCETGSWRSGDGSEERGSWRRRKGRGLMAEALVRSQSSVEEGGPGQGGVSQPGNYVLAWTGITKYATARARPRAECYSYLAR